MRRRLTVRRLTAIGACLALGALIVSTATANHSWANYHWARSANPLNLQVGDNVSGVWGSHLTDAITDWDKSSVLSLSRVNGQARKNCKATSGRIEVCNGTYGNNGWLGIAQIWVSGDHITAAITKVNDTYFNASPYNTPAWRQLVMCQEVGHDFGLDHQDENFNNPNLGTCMDYTSAPEGGGSFGPSNLEPNSHDYQQLASIYAHLDGGGGGGGGGGDGGNCPPKNPHCSGGSVGNAPPFSQASRAKGSVYVDRLPAGGKRITHVFWTPFGD